MLTGKQVKTMERREMYVPKRAERMPKWSVSCHESWASSEWHENVWNNVEESMQNWKIKDTI
jgi:hypothetical protein